MSFKQDNANYFEVELVSFNLRCRYFKMFFFVVVILNVFESLIDVLLTYVFLVFLLNVFSFIYNDTYLLNYLINLSILYAQSVLIQQHLFSYEFLCFILFFVYLLREMLLNVNTQTMSDLTDN